MAAKSRREYERYEDAIREEKARMTTATETGIEIGIEKEKRENAINFLKLGVDINIVSKGTGLSIEELKALKKEL